MVLLVLLVLCALAPRFVSAPRLPDSSDSSKALFDSEGKLLSLSLTRDDKYRLFTPYGDISPELIESTLLYEDKHFFSHFGVNPISTFRGALQTILRPSKPVGGSTISMQLARLLVGLQTRSISGKLKQMFWAVVLEAHYSKRSILEAYLNLAPYGANVEGVGAASLVYYRKRAEEISAGEAVSLAVLPQHPTARVKERGRASLEAARIRLVERWKDRKDIQPQELRHSAADIPATAQHFFLRVQDEYPKATEFSSTLDATLQREAELVLQSNLDRYKEYGVTNGTLLLAELPNMEVRAYVGSANYLREDISGYVNGLAAKRSPGSALKPFIYAIAIDQGKLIPDSMLSDVPLRLASYRPENFERNFAGPITATDALVRSRNIPALEVFRELSSGSFYQFLNQAGVRRLLSEDYYGIALVLGGLGVSSEELAQLYGVLGRNGSFEPLKFLISDRAEKSAPPLISSEASFLVRDMLSHNPPALGKFREQKIAWKTGTSFGSKDAWAAGFVGRYVLVVWLGNFDGKPNANLTGRDFAGPVFFSMVDRLMSSKILLPPPLPAQLNLKRVEVCALTGQLPSPDCPHRKEAWFVPGVSPIATCSVHKKITIDPVTGLRACPGMAGDSKVFEVWNSDMQELFARAGLKRNTPPSFDAACELKASSPDKIRILSPEEHLDYYLEAHRELELEFLSAAPGEAKLISWFVNDSPIAQAPPRESVYWKAQVGTFEVRAVDDLGRSAKVKIKVLPAV